VKTLFSILLILPLLSFSQELNYAREVINKLTSEELAGRGYVNHGDQKAASFIQEEFKKIGLKPVGKSFIQNFETSINTFPSSMELSVNGKTLIPGEDYIIDPSSPSIKGQYQTVLLSIEDLQDQNELVNVLRAASGKFIVIPSYDKSAFSKDQQKELNEVINLIKYHPEITAAGTLILTEEKLTWSGATFISPRPTFTIKSDRSWGKIQSVKVNVKNKFFESYKAQNVIGMIEGERKDSLIVLTAHYDHLGMMGKEAMFPGANDNASGVAMLLNLAKHYEQNTPKFTTVFIAFGGEELGLLGSKYFVDHPLIDLSKIKFLINFDIAGTGDDGIQVVNGKIFKKQFDQLVAINEQFDLLKQVKIRGESCNSDHCLFYQQGVPSFFIYTLGGIQAYHDIYDKAETLPLTEFEDYFKLMTDFIKTL